MIQLKSKRIIITVSIIALAVVIVASFFLLKENLLGDAYVDPKNTLDIPGRPLTAEERQMVGIAEDQKVELVNKKEGLFIYKVVK